jgi:tetratricopeptide (TPR) repeat protein
MKKVILLAALVLPLAVAAQKAPKEIKPNVNKAEASRKDNKLDEAKANIDLCVQNEKMKLDAKTWYYRGLIYASIDTSTNAAFRALEANAFNVAMEAFKKCEEIDKGKTNYFITDETGLPILDNMVKASYATAYYNASVQQLQEEKNYAGSFASIKKAVTLYPDTSILYVAGVFIAPQAEENDQAVEWCQEYIKKGGTSSDAYVAMFGIYRDKKKDNAKALEVIKEARVKFPDNTEFPKYELNIYLSEKKYTEARAFIEEDLKRNPNDTESMYLLGRLQVELGDTQGAKATFEKALSLDPNYFDALAGLTDLYWKDAKAIKDQMANLGNSKEDMAKMKQLDPIYVQKLNVYLPYLERCEKLQPDNIDILYQLLTVYAELEGNETKIARVKKRLKALGEDVD